MQKSFYSPQDVNIADFEKIIQQGAEGAEGAERADACEYSLNVDIQKGVVIYDAKPILQAVLDNDTDTVTAYKNEMCFVLSDGAGVFAISGLYTDMAVLDNANTVFDRIHQSQQGDKKGDHFSAAGNNMRIWNALQKLAVQSPADFVDYYKNPVLHVVCAAWLGTGYQLTSQINGVPPGGTSQHMHRDYHLGFQSDATCATFPLSIQKISPFLTLQGAVAHTEMPIDTGPTKLLPHSQKYDLGYMAWRQQDFIDYFDAHYVQLHLQKGDGVFFNPALFHAAGGNVTADKTRIANLLQVSCAFGKTMETLNYPAMIQSVYPVLQRAYVDGVVTADEVHNISGCIADGYAFPTNLEKDIPQGEVAPQSLQSLVAAHALQGSSHTEVMTAVAAKLHSRTD